MTRLLKLTVALIVLAATASIADAGDRRVLGFLFPRAHVVHQNRLAHGTAMFGSAPRAGAGCVGTQTTAYGAGCSGVQASAGCQGSVTRISTTPSAVFLPLETGPATLGTRPLTLPLKPLK